MKNQINEVWFTPNQGILFHVNEHTLQKENFGKHTICVECDEKHKAKFKDNTNYLVNGDLKPIGKKVIFTPKCYTSMQSFGETGTLKGFMLLHFLFIQEKRSVKNSKERKGKKEKAVLESTLELEVMFEYMLNKLLSSNASPEAKQRDLDILKNSLEELDLSENKENLKYLIRDNYWNVYN